MAGEQPKVVQERLGHSQISVTLDTYSHVLPSMQREAAEKAERLVLGRGRCVPDRPASITPHRL